MRHRRSTLVVLAALLAVVGSSWALAAESLQLGSEFRGWVEVADDAARAAVVDEVRPLTRPHAFSCRSPEVFVHPELTTIEEALARYLPELRSGLREEVVDEAPGYRLAIVDGLDLMFERLSVLWLRPDGVWLLVC